MSEGDGAGGFGGHGIISSATSWIQTYRRRSSKKGQYAPLARPTSTARPSNDRSQRALTCSQSSATVRLWLQIAFVRHTATKFGGLAYLTWRGCRRPFGDIRYDGIASLRDARGKANATANLLRVAIEFGVVKQRSHNGLFVV